MRLGVNVDHVATVRQARGGIEPDPLRAALEAIEGGADGITVHLREDRRHIQDIDLRRLREGVSIELNLEMAATNEMIRIALEVRPDMVTLVPEKRRELTTEGGLNLRQGRRKIETAIDKIQGAGIPVSLFINPSISDVITSRRLGATMVEIHTGRYADTEGKRQEMEFRRVERAIRKGIEVGLVVNAGHGLNYSNVQRVARIGGLRGLYIGHSIVSRAIFVGIKEAVREMKELISGVTD